MRLRAVASWLVPVAVLVVVYLVFVVHLRRSDYLVFLRAGNDVLAGRNPYPSLDDPFLYGGSAFVYPWLTGFLFAPFTLLPEAVGELVFLALSGLALIAGCRWAGVRNPLVISTLLLAATTVRGLQVGSLNAFLFLGLVLAWRWRDQPARLGPLLVLVVGIKLFLLPLLVWVALTRRWQALAATSLGLALLFLGSFALGPVGPSQYVSLLHRLSSHESQQGFSLQRLLSGGLGAGGAQAVCLVIALGLLGLGTAVQVRTGREFALWTAALLAAVVLTPILWSHYLLLALTPLLLVPVRRPSTRAALVVAGAAVSWLVARPDKTEPLVRLDIHHAITALHLGLLAMFVGVCVQALRQPRSVDHPALRAAV